jgi:hypothetical protein
MKLEVGELVQYWASGEDTDAVITHAVVTSLESWVGWVEVFDGRTGGISAVPKWRLRKMSQPPVQVPTTGYIQIIKEAAMTLRQELLRDLDVALERKYIVFLDYDRNPRLITTDEWKHLFSPAEGYYGPYSCGIRAALLDVPIYLGGLSAGDTE